MQFDAPTEDEWPFIFDSWANSWMKSPWAGTVRNCDWPEVSRKASSEIVDRATTRVTVLWQETEDGVRRIVGYSVSEPAQRVIHWIYVRRDCRGYGNGRRLLQEIMGDTRRSEWVYTHRTNACSRFFRGMKHDKSRACLKA
jgi:GNAT superfamily N-acetyltransferase